MVVSSTSPVENLPLSSRKVQRQKLVSIPALPQNEHPSERSCPQQLTLKSISSLINFRIVCRVRQGSWEYLDTVVKKLLNRLGYMRPLHRFSVDYFGKQEVIVSRNPQQVVPAKPIAKPEFSPPYALHWERESRFSEKDATNMFIRSMLSTLRRSIPTYHLCLAYRFFAAASSKYCFAIDRARENSDKSFRYWILVAQMCHEWVIPRRPG